MKRTMVESPLRGDGWFEISIAQRQLRYERNLRYARACMRHALAQGEAAFPMHCLYPQVLDDRDETERHLGLAAGLSWAEVAEKVAVYLDLGVSQGMKLAVQRAEQLEIPIVYRSGIWPGGVEPA